MTVQNTIVTFIFLALSLPLMGQNNCDYKIDSTAIYLNQNLDKFVSEIKNKQFLVSHDIKDIPPTLRAKLDCLTRGFSIANPDEEYKASCTSEIELPKRQLLFLGISEDVFIMTYLTGGIGVATHLLFINFRGDTITDLWAGVCFPELKSTKDILKFLEKNKQKQWGLHANIFNL